jgi:predicted TIM-barrel fold metal-dependent hydrolase
MTSPSSARRRGDKHHYVDWTWLTQSIEEVLEPDLPIIDPHHHFWDRRPHGSLYLLPEFLQDIDRSGHRVCATVFVECLSMYRADGDRRYACVGEVEFVNGLAAMSASGLYGPTRVAAGIVGGANLLEGAREAEVILACMERAPERFRGVRHITAWDASPEVSHIEDMAPGMMTDERFREGFSELAPLGLTFDAYAYHPQLPELIDLADKFPNITIVINHMGGRVGLGPYAARLDEVFVEWRRHIRELGKRPNVYVKLGGIGMRLAGLGFHDRDVPPTSQQLADAWRPAFETCVEAFGTARAMFESNYPVDKTLCTYRVLWNTFKRLAKNFSETEKTSLFGGTAATVYRLPGELASAGVQTSTTMEGQ